MPPSADCWQPCWHLLVGRSRPSTGLLAAVARIHGRLRCSTTRRIWSRVSRRGTDVCAQLCASSGFLSATRSRGSSSTRSPRALGGYRPWTRCGAEHTSTSSCSTSASSGRLGRRRRGCSALGLTASSASAIVAEADAAGALGPTQRILRCEARIRSRVRTGRPLPALTRPSSIVPWRSPLWILFVTASRLTIISDMDYAAGLSLVTESMSLCTSTTVLFCAAGFAVGRSSASISLNREPHCGQFGTLALKPPSILRERPSGARDRTRFRLYIMMRVARLLRHVPQPFRTIDVDPHLRRAQHALRAARCMAWQPAVFVCMNSCRGLTEVGHHPPHICCAATCIAVWAFWVIFVFCALRVFAGELVALRFTYAPTSSPIKLAMTQAVLT